MQIKDILFNKSENRYQMIIWLIIICLFFYFVPSIFGVSIVPDEFGYWAHSANALGYDWTDIASLGSYYSFGYSLILTPILFLFKDSIVAYRVALGVNFLLVGISAIIFQKILNKIFPKLNDLKKIFISAIAMLYPAWIFYSFMTLVESLLTFLFILSVYLMILYLEKPSLKTGIGLIITLVYMYVVHMRMVAVLIAAVMTIVIDGIYRLIKNRSIRDAAQIKKYVINIAVLVAVLAGLMLIMYIIKKQSVAGVFSKVDEEYLAINDYGSQWGKIKDILTIKGLIRFIFEISGKVYYLFCASFGMLGIVLYSAIKKINKIYIYIVLAILGETLLSAIYMHNGGLTDSLIYGRYLELLMPIIILFGMAELMNERTSPKWIYVIFSAGLGIVSFVMTYIALGKYDYHRIRGYHTASVDYLNIVLDDEKMIIIATFGIYVGLFTLIIFLNQIISKRMGIEFLLIIICIVELYGIHRLTDRYVLSVNIINHQDMNIADRINAEYVEGQKIGYIISGTPEAIDFSQMQLGMKGIDVITIDDINGYDYVIASNEIEERDILDNAFTNIEIGSSFYLYY